MLKEHSSATNQTYEIIQEVLTYTGGLLGAVSIVMNILVIWAYALSKPLKFPTYLLYINMAVAGIMIGLDGILTLINFQNGSLKLSKGVCIMLGVVASGKRSTLDMLTLLSIGRLVAIQLPFSYRTIFSHRKTLFYISVSWILCSAKFYTPFFTGGGYKPTVSGWCNAVVNITPAHYKIFERTTVVAPLIISIATCVGCSLATLAILWRRKQLAALTHNKPSDEALKILTLMLICFIACFSMWLFVETLGAFSEGGISTSTFIDGKTPPNQLTFLLYKLMLTGIIVFGPVNAWLLLRGKMGPVVRSVNDFC